MNSKIDKYLVAGCGRCPLGGTPECKVHNWVDELTAVRHILLNSELTEELKWGVPCYTFDNKNVLLLSALNGSCTLSFFKGALLQDPHQILKKPGANTQAGRVIPFTSVAEIDKLKVILKMYIAEAIEVEKAGLTYSFKETLDYEVPKELQTKLNQDPTLNAAFEALTPGRQRGYLLYFSAPKKSSTRASRVEKYIPKILSGKGVHDRD